MIISFPCDPLRKPSKHLRSFFKYTAEIILIEFERISLMNNIMMTRDQIQAALFCYQVSLNMTFMKVYRETKISPNWSTFQCLINHCEFIEIYIAALVTRPPLHCTARPLQPLRYRKNWTTLFNVQHIWCLSYSSYKSWADSFLLIFRPCSNYSTNI